MLIIHRIDSVSTVDGETIEVTYAARGWKGLVIALFPVLSVLFLHCQLDWGRAGIYGSNHCGFGYVELCSV